MSGPFNGGGDSNAGSPIQFKDEGISLGSNDATSVNFTGAGVIATRSLNEIDVSINGGSGATVYVDNFPASGTWTNRPGITAVYVRAWGGGAGGGGGFSGATQQAGGGGGGSSGYENEYFMMASDLPSSVSVTIGAGGTGGAAGANGSARFNGGDGGGGGGSSVAAGGNGGTGGFPAGGGGGGAGAQIGIGGTGGTGGAGYMEVISW